MQATKEEFQQWRESHVTKEVFEVIDQRIQDAKDILGVSAGDDPVADRYLVGMIRAFNELKDISYGD